VSFDTRPLSRTEAAAALPVSKDAPAQWLSDMLAIPAWSRKLVLKPAASEGAQAVVSTSSTTVPKSAVEPAETAGLFADVTITYGTIRPLDFVFN
jgi:hypothetical protein